MRVSQLRTSLLKLKMGRGPRCGRGSPTPEFAVVDYLSHATFGDLACVYRRANQTARRLGVVEMSQRYVFSGHTIGANETIEVGVQCTAGTIWRPQSFQGPALFQAVPNTMALRPVFVTESGMTCFHMGGMFSDSDCYYCRIRNDNASVVGFDLHMVTFGDEPFGGQPWQPAPEVEQPPFDDMLANVKLALLWGPDGEIAGTAVQPAGSTSPGLIPGPGQSVDVIDMPEELAGIGDVMELHAKLKAHLQKCHAAAR
jgi:hypothetical protein